MVQNISSSHEFKDVYILHALDLPVKERRGRKVREESTEQGRWRRGKRRFEGGSEERWRVMKGEVGTEGS